MPLDPRRDGGGVRLFVLHHVTYTLVIRGLAACALAWDVVTVSPDRQAHKRERCTEPSGS
jgi:hypothetical protein